MRARGKRHSGLNRTDPRVAQLLEDSVENRAALTPKQRRDRARTKATYDLSKEVQSLVQKIAALEETSGSQVVEWLLTVACNEYLAANPAVLQGFQDKEISRTPRFVYNLLPPEEPRQEALALLQRKQPVRLDDESRLAGKKSNR